MTFLNPISILKENSSGVRVFNYSSVSHNVMNFIKHQILLENYSEDVIPKSDMFSKEILWEMRGVSKTSAFDVDKLMVLLITNCAEKWFSDSFNLKVVLFHMPLEIMFIDIIFFDRLNKSFVEVIEVSFRSFCDV